MAVQPENTPARALSVLVNLKAVPNPDLRQGYPHFDVPHYQVEVPTLRDAVAVCRMYIGKYELGGSNWVGGQVYDAQGNEIARISYNGRVWEPGPWQTAKEIEL